MKVGRAYLYRDGVLTERLMRIDWPEYHIPVPPPEQSILEEPSLVTPRKVDVYKRHGLRGKYPVFTYVRTDVSQ